MHNYGTGSDSEPFVEDHTPSALGVSDNSHETRLYLALLFTTTPSSSSELF